MKIVHFDPGEYQLRSMNMKIVQNGDLKEWSLVIGQWSLGGGFEGIVIGH